MIATNYGDLNSYVKKSGAILTIQSMITGKTVKLPGFLTDLSQNFSSTWNTEDVFGRVDPIATFQGTGRTISLSLDLPADSAKVARSNLDSCSKIATFLYPSYVEKKAKIDATGKVGGAGIKEYKVAAIQNKAPLVKIKFGNLVKSTATGGGLLGYIDSFSFNPSFDDGVFNPSRGKFYPRVINVSISFNPLHQDILGWSEHGNWAGARLPFK